MKQWSLRKPIPEKISKKLEKWPELIRQILFYRGIKTEKGAEKFLNPDYEKGLRNPFDILNMNKATERILKAIKNKERIVIFGDYDADGVASCAIFYDFFKKIGFENFHFHIPDRHLDGYGLTMESIDEFISQNANFIITLDCGITDYEEVEKANSAGIDVIIIDHHLVPEKLPNAFAIVDSKQKEDKYPFKFLSGAGVGFKVIQALVKRGNFNVIPGWEKWLLDFVAIATVADMVSLVDENRILVHYGLKVLRKTRRPGLLSFFRRLDINPNQILEDDIAFMIAPRINIAGRMDHANTSFELLITSSSEEADWITSRLEILNADRKNAVEKILNEISKRIEKKKITPTIIVEGDLTWNVGVLGLGATKLTERYSCPVFLWGKGVLPAKGTKTIKIKGSCRIPAESGINLIELMGKLPKDFLIEFGGHVKAGGFSIKDEKINSLEKEISLAFEKMPKQKRKDNI
jgi:single-stranded-DNA-specific exonuclease